MFNPASSPVTPQFYRSVEAAAPKFAVETIMTPVGEAADIEAALASIGLLELATPPRVLITGSLYLAGAVLDLNGTLPT